MQLSPPATGGSITLDAAHALAFPGVPETQESLQRLSTILKSLATESDAKAAALGAFLTPACPAETGISASVGVATPSHRAADTDKGPHSGGTSPARRLHPGISPQTVIKVDILCLIGWCFALTHSFFAGNNGAHDAPAPKKQKKGQHSGHDLATSVNNGMFCMMLVSDRASALLCSPKGV